MKKIGIKGTIIASDEAWIYDWFGIENTNPKKVQKALEEANGDDVEVEINSPGGSVFAGSEIYSALRGYTGKLKIHVVGIAASAASVIACAGPSDISPTAQMMVHNVSMSTAGDYHEMDHASEVLQKANRAIAAAYIEKTGMPEKDVLDLMDCETWLTAKEAVDYGLIDEISAPAHAQVEPQRMVAAYGSILPAQVVDRMQKERIKLQLDLLNLKGEERK